VPEGDTLNVMTIERNKNTPVNGYKYSAADITKS
jgi:hypothetical protein